jgi:hypothetical protein
MRRLKRFANLSWPEQSLLLQAIFLLSLVAVGLRLLPFGLVQRMVILKSPNSGTGRSVNNLVWAITAASRCLAMPTCLNRALAGQALLARYGYESKLEIGVAKNEDLQFEAHAWLVFGEQILIGGPEVDHYTSLATWNAKS